MGSLHRIQASRHVERHEGPPPMWPWVVASVVVVGMVVAIFLGFAS